MSSQHTDSPQAKLVQLLAEGLAKRDPGLVASILHKDHRRVYYPRSLGLPEQTKEQFIQHLGEIMSFWTDTPEPVVRSIIEAPGTIIFHGTNKAKTSIGVEMTRESIFIMRLATDEDGILKIKQTEEFTDSKAYLDFFKAVAEAKAKKESSSHSA